MRLHKQVKFAPPLVQDVMAEEQLKRAFDSIDATIRETRRVREKAAELMQRAEELRVSHQ